MNWRSGWPLNQYGTPAASLSSAIGAPGVTSRSGAWPLTGSSTVCRPTGRNRTLSPRCTVIVSGKNALASALSLPSVFWLAGGVPMYTVLVAARASPAGPRAVTIAMTNTARDTGRTYRRRASACKGRRADLARRPRLLSGNDERLLVAVRLAALGLLDQRGRRREALAVRLGQLSRA